LGADVPKAFVPLGGKPLFMHSLETFARLPFVKAVALVLPGAWIERARKRWGSRFDALKVVALVPGGARRQDSVRAGLDVLQTPLVLVHDAARPLIGGAAVKDVAQAAARHGAAVLAAAAVDTVKVADKRGRVLDTPNRARVWMAQTPQGFRREVLVEAYRKAGRKDATDDCQLVERSGRPVVVVPSTGPNFKVTSREDLLRAVKLLDSQ